MQNSTNYDDKLSYDQLYTIGVFKIIGSSFSLIGTSLIIFIYLYLKIKLKSNDHRKSVTNKNESQSEQNDKNKHLKMGFGHNLIFLLSLSDFVYSFSTFIKFPGLTEVDEDLLPVDASCIAQGFLINFSEISSICWTSIISLMIYMGTYADITNLPKLYLYGFLYSYGSAAFLSFGPLISSSYGPAGSWCWMNTADVKALHPWIWTLIIYVFSWINIGFNIFAIVKAIKYFKIRAFELKYENLQEHSYLKQFCIVLKFFPMILVMCWIFPTINRLYIFASKKPNFVLSCLHTIFFSLTGFFNSLVYSYYYRKFIPCIKCFFDLKEDSQTENKIKNDNNEKVEIKPSSDSPQIENGYVLNVTEKETGKNDENSIN